MRIVNSLPTDVLDRELVLLMPVGTVYLWMYHTKEWIPLAPGALWSAYESRGLVMRGQRLFVRLPDDKRNVSYEPEQIPEEDLPNTMRPAGTLIEVEGECYFVVSDGDMWIEI